MNLDLSIIFSICALLISLGSLAWSIHIGLRDRSKLQTKCQIYGRKTKSPSVVVTVTNRGRRPIILTKLGISYADGSSTATLLGENGKTLNEGEFYKEDSRSDYSLITSNNGEEAVSFWFEDSFGRRHFVKNSNKFLDKFFGRKKTN